MSIQSALTQLADTLFLTVEKKNINLGSAFAIIAEHLYFVWRHAKTTSAKDILSVIMLYQHSSMSVVVRDQVEEALAVYFNSINIPEAPEEPEEPQAPQEPEGSLWSHFKDVLPNRKVKREVKRRARREAEKEARKQAKIQARIQVKNQAKEILQETIYNTVLSNRLDKTGL